MVSSGCEPLNALLKEVISKNNGDFHCMKCFHLLRIKVKKKLILHARVIKIVTSVN